MAEPLDPQPISIKLLKTVLTSEHLPAIFAGQDTHDPALRLVAQLVPHTDSIERITDIIAAALPAGYSGDTLREIPEMVRGALAKGFDSKFGSNKDQSRDKDKKPSIIQQITALEVHLFHDAQGRSFISAPLKTGKKVNLLLPSNAADAWVREFIYRTEGTAISSSALSDTVETLAAIAQFDGPEEEAHLRLGATEAPTIIIDLGDKDGNSVEIAPSGWRVIDDAPIRMWRSPGFGPLPRPAPDGDINDLRKLLGLDYNSWLLVLGFLLGALRPSGPYFCLLIEGEQGSGKTYTCSIIRRIIDPHRAEKIRLPTSERDLMIQAKEQHLLVYDNISGMRGEMSDALCVLATGGGLATRRLYSNDEQQLFVACRPFIINGIADFVNRPDLLERAILINLPPMPAGSRKTEAQMNAEFERIWPGVIGRLYDAVARALRYENETAAPPDFRMADAARWITAAEPALGLDAGTIVGAIAEAQKLAMVERVQNNPLILAIELQLDKQGPFAGTVGQLFDAIITQRRLVDRGLPTTPAHLSRQLKRQRPAAAKAGIHIEFGDHHRDGRSIRIWGRPDDERPPTNWGGTHTFPPI